MTTKIKPSVLANTTVNPGTYGGVSAIPTYIVDAQGRITSSANVAISLTASGISGLAPSATIDTTNATNITSGTLAVARLPSSGAVAGTYGSSSQVAQTTVDAYGRVTTITNVSIVLPATSITGLASSATVNTTIANNITSGTLSVARLPGSGVAAGTYDQVTVDAYGRVTSDTNNSVSVGPASLSTAGIVQLTDSISSTSTTTAATPNSVKTVADSRAAINPGSPKNGDIQVSGSTVYVYAGGWRQVFPAVYG